MGNRELPALPPPPGAPGHWVQMHGFTKREEAALRILCSLQQARPHALEKDLVRDAVARADALFEQLEDSR